MAKVTIHTFMHDFGQMVDWITVETDSALPALTAADFVCEKSYVNLSATEPTTVTSVEVTGSTVKVTFVPFLYRIDFAVKCEKLNLTVTKETADKVELYHEDWFEAVVEDDLYYRLYSPKAFGPRPLILYLHGGGGCGYDNTLQLTDTLGAIKLAERCPDMYVLAPQAPAGALSFEDALKRMNANNDHFKVVIRNDPENGLEDRGWVRWYLAKVMDLIRRMIAEGKVDARRVYVIGMSMGGCGTLKAVSLAPDLFAACVPICPSMNGETWPILANFPKVPAYIATSYIDHQANRHAYLMRAIQQLWDRDRRDVRFTMFTSYELAEYGIGINPNVTTAELYGENHNSWILVFHNEMGILDWMFSHVKE